MGTEWAPKVVVCVMDYAGSFDERAEAAAQPFVRLTGFMIEV